MKKPLLQVYKNSPSYCNIGGMECTSDGKVPEEAQIQLEVLLIEKTLQDVFSPMISWIYKKQASLAQTST